MKKFLSGLLLTIMVVATVACGKSEGELNDQAAVRQYDPFDGTIYIEDEATALVGSVEDAAMTEAERQRAAELRAIAVEAFNLTNEQRIANGLPALVWRDDLAAAAQVRAIEAMSVVSSRLYAIASTLCHITANRIRTADPFFIISSLSRISLLPTAFIA